MPSRRDGPAASVLAGLLQQEKAHAAPPRTFPVILASLTFQLKRFFLLEELAILPTSQSRWGPQTAHHPSVCLFVCLFVCFHSTAGGSTVSICLLDCKLREGRAHLLLMYPGAPALGRRLAHGGPPHPCMAERP